MTAPTRSHGRKSIRAMLSPSDLMGGPGDFVGAWKARVITLFPEVFPGILGASLTGKALAEGLWQLDCIDLRPFGLGRHRNVDDTPVGGGAGMVLRPDVLAAALACAPEIARNCLAHQSDPPRLIATALRYQCQRLQFGRNVQPEHCRTAGEAGLTRNLFWSDELADARAYAAMGIDVILTNEAHRLLPLVATAG